MTAPAGSVAAATRSGADLTSGPSPYKGELADSAEARAWQAARDAAERASVLDQLRERVAEYNATIEQAQAERIETLAEIAGLTGDA